MALAHCFTCDNSEARRIKAEDLDAHVREIVDKDDFSILTTLLWVRWPTQNQTDYSDGTRLASTTEQFQIAASQSGSDLGLLRFHQDRLAAAAEALSWRHIKSLDRGEQGQSMLRASIQTHLDSLPQAASNITERRRLRITIDKNGTVQVGSTVMNSVPASLQHADPFTPKTFELSESVENPCQVIIDLQPTSSSLFTTHKTVYRPHYDAARQRVGVSTALPTDKEVLLYNHNGEIMEASLCTVYLYRNGDWITPAAVCGGNLGVTRRLAIENSLCKEGTVKLSDLKSGEMIWLSNAARGFFVGRLCLTETPPMMSPIVP